MEIFNSNIKYEINWILYWLSHQGSPKISWSVPNLYWVNWVSLVAQQQRICLQCRSHRRCKFYPWVGKIPWRREWQPTPVFLPGESYGQRSLVGYSPWGHRELDTTEHACFKKRILWSPGFQELIFTLCGRSVVLMAINFSFYLCSFP